MEKMEQKMVMPVNKGGCRAGGPMAMREGTPQRVVVER